MIVFFFLSIFFIGAMVSGLSEDKKVVVGDNSVLHLELDAEINEMQQEDPLAGLPIPGAGAPKIGLLQLKQAIANAKDDDKIKGIYIEVTQPLTGFATIEEIRESILDFKEDGK